MFKWQNPLLTLGERCVSFAENEMRNGIKEDSPNSFTSPRIREYLSICTRKVNDKEVPINITSGNWCAASVSFCLKNSILPGETVPHGYRVGVIEIVSDLQLRGLWYPINEVIQQFYQIKIGDIIVFDRSQSNRPETAWWRHIGRVYEINGDEFKCISGNSYGTWKISSHKMSQKNLLGFGEYPSISSIVNTSVYWNHLSVQDLAPMEDTGKDLESFFDIYGKIFTV